MRELDDEEPGDGEVLVRNVFVSVDPYMRGRMTGVRTYVPPYELGDVINGGAVGRVVASKDAGFAEGDWVQLDARLARGRRRLRRRLHQGRSGCRAAVDRARRARDAGLHRVDRARRDRPDRRG